MDRVPQYASLRNRTTQGTEGIVVSDDKGLVVLWPDGHCSRFVWSLLRHMCPCQQCHQEQDNDSFAHLHNTCNTTIAM